MYLDFLWSKGIYFRNNNMISYNTTEPNKEYILSLMNNDDYIIWIRNSVKRYKIKDLDYFSENIHLLKKNIILITGDSDLSVPSCYSKKTVNSILNNQFVQKWYTQNYDRTIIHDKLSYFPIGLDLHTNRWLINNCPIEKIKYIIKIRFMNVERINNKIFCDSHLRITNNERKVMYEKIKNNKRLHFSDKLYGFNKIIIKYRLYNFVLSPVGNGLDCHRTWELFLLGCIVITKSSPLDNMWIENKLPVVILNDWTDLNNNLKSKLKVWYELYYKYTGFDYILKKFNYNYWLNLDNTQLKILNKNIINKKHNHIKEQNNKSDEIYDTSINGKINFINSKNNKIANNIILNYDIDEKYLTIDSHIDDYDIIKFINNITSINNLITE